MDMTGGMAVESNILLQLAKLIEKRPTSEISHKSVTDLITNYIETSEVINDDIISKYTEAIDTENVNNDTLELSLKVINQLIAKSYFGPPTLQLILITFSLLTASEDKAIISITAMIKNPVTEIMDHETKLKYIQLQLALLKTITSDATLTTTHMNDIVTGFTSTSSFFHCLTQLYTVSENSYYNLTSIFIKLSLSVKTIYRLVFLITAAHYSIFTGQPKLELLSRVNKDGLKMFSKSNSVVYKMTATFMFNLVQECNTKDVPTTALSGIIEAFSKEEMNQKLHLEWNKKEISTNELVSPLQSMTIHENLLLSLKSKSWDSLIKTKGFIQNIKNTIKDMDLDDSQNHLMISSLITSIMQNIISSKVTIMILDDIIMKLKNININESNANFIYITLQSIAEYMKTINELKRLGNCSKLLFYFGSAMLKLNGSKSLPFWKSFIFYENETATSIDSQLVTLKRLNYISSLEVSADNYATALNIQLLFLNDVVDMSMDPYACTALLVENFDSSMKIITKCILKNQGLIENMFEYLTSESLIIAITLDVIRNLENIKVTMKEQIISSVILTLKEKIHDSGLFFYFLSNISMIISFPINFNVGSLSFPTTSPVLHLESLVLSHLYILQTFTDTKNVSNTILKSYFSLSTWLKTNTSFSDYEFTIFQTIYQSMKYNELFEYAVDLVELYISHRNEELEEKNSSILLSCLLECFLKLDKYESCQNIITKNGHYVTKSIETPHDIEFYLNVLKYYNITNDARKMDLILKVNDAFSTIDKFNISNQRDKYDAVELILLHAKFCQIVGESFPEDQLRSITNLNRSITLLQSIFKNFLLGGPNVPSLNTNFKYILKMKFSYQMLESYNEIIQMYASVGFGKEFDYYLKELDVFVNIQPSINLQYHYNLRLMEFSLFKNALKEASEYYDTVKQKKEQIVFDNNLFIEIYSLIVFENYARRIKDNDLVHTISKRLDNLIFNFLKDTTVDSVSQNTVILKWIEALKRRYQYLCDGDLDDYKLVIDSSIKHIVEYHNCLKDFEKHHDNRYISLYPITKEPTSDRYEDECFEKMKVCNQNMISDFEISQSTDSVEVSKYTLNMIIAIFVNMLKYDKSVKMNDELTKLVLINDKFKYKSFTLAKQFAVTNFKKNSVLPELPLIVAQDHEIESKHYELYKVLPENWSAISIDYVAPINSLMITKYDKRYEKPLFISISLDKHRNKQFDTTLKNLRDIIEDSDKSTQIEVTSMIKTNDEKLKWWETRKALDARLENLLMDIDEYWFGGFNSIFHNVNYEASDVEKVKNAVRDVLLKTINIDTKIQNELNSLHPGIYELFLKIEGLTTGKVQDLLTFIFDLINSNMKASDSFLNLAARELKSHILKIKTDPRKVEQKHHIVLIPGTSCTNIPWESIPSLKSKSVTRMPTILQLTEYLRKYEDMLKDGVNSNKGYYVINPGGDLKRTEENLSPRFKHLDGWNGIIGSPPTESKLIDAFDTSNLYIYAGHGGGEQYIKSKTIKARDQIPPSLLLGCSSGSLKGDGLIHPYGTAYNYINGGCPMLLVNLWDVTDKDIDLFTVKALTKWGFLVDYDSLDPFDLEVEGSVSLSECVSQSRDVCKLKYLNGAAPVIYGLPLCLESN